MARSNIDVVVKVTDLATNPLKEVNRNIKAVGDTTKKVGADVVQFNRVLFSAMATIGFYTKAFSGLTRSIVEGARFDRVSKQFENLLGPRGQFIEQISEFTDVGIDSFEALKQGIQLKMLGITKGMTDTAKLLAMSGVAAKNAGLDTAEGMKNIVEFAKSGSIHNLENIGLIKRTDVGYQALTAALGKASGVMSNVVLTQFRLKLGMDLLEKKTRGTMKGFADLESVVTNFRDRINLARFAIGEFLGKSVTPLIDSITKLALKTFSFFDRIRDNKSLQEMVRRFVVLGGAISAFIGGLATLQLSLKALSFLGIGGFPLIMTMITALGLTFDRTTKPIEKITEFIKAFGSSIAGVAQLVSSFLFDAENYKKGVGKMDKSLHDYLKSVALVRDEHGNIKISLLDLVVGVSKFTIVVTKFVTDVGKKLISWFEKIDQLASKLFDRLGGGEALKKLIPRSLIDDGTTLRDILVDITAAFLGLKLVSKIPILGGLLSKIPGIGGLFGGRPGGGPKGTVTDPMYVVSVGDRIKGAAGAIGGFLGKHLGALFKTIGRNIGLGSLIKAIERLGFSKAIMAFINRIPILNRLTGALGSVGRLISGVPATIGSILGRLPGIFSSAIAAAAPALAIAMAGAVGFAIGTVIEPYVTKMLDKYTTGKTEEGFEGNILERGFFKLFADEQTKTRFKQFEEFKNKSDEEIIKDFKEQKAAKAKVSIPVMPETEQEKVDAITRTIDTLQGEQKQQMIDAFIESKESASKGGTDISDAEWMEIMMVAVSKGLDMSQTGKKLAEGKGSETSSGYGDKR
jgi:hypothetical protein